MLRTPVLALPQDEPVLAALGPIGLRGRLRRELGIRLRDQAALVITDRDVLVVASRKGRTRVAARYPRDGARVLEFRTLVPEGDFLIDRIVIATGDVAIRLDFDGRLHRDGEAVVAALGGVVPAR